MTCNGVMVMADSTLYTSRHQISSLSNIRFPPTRRPSERKHRCQRAWL